ncbi:formate dehydrogenase subunit delta [Frigidibacter oleivorans]|uniref:formate dehydrogenase subunit delta n=1 Tax=Frigidibacter oleivorans TaxID=2487129 RepID=UPI00197A9B1B|nr:formate dehydrogenase subunit delta [Frigidibacter oleivorans]
MTTSGGDKIIRMANQIATFMASRSGGGAEAAEGLAAHINDFWEPRMRRQLFELIDAEAAGFEPLVREAAPHIRRPAETA